MTVTTRITQLFKEFFASESTGGLILIFATVLALVIANSPWNDAYLDTLHGLIGGKSLEFWVNDGLMTFFFLLVGLEIERELYIGELSNRQAAMLPVSAAIGGMVIPVAIFALFNVGGPGIGGFGIPMATDIAFALGILSLLGNRVPFSLKIFLTALAIIDDMGGVLLISIFYAKGLSLMYLGSAAGIFLVMLLLNRLKVWVLWPYLLLGVGLWICLYQGGIHPTVTGILLAFAIPFGKGDEASLSYRLQHNLHLPVAFLVMPVFALANAGIAFSASDIGTLGSGLSLGIFLGLVLGKPLGVVLFSWLAIRMSIANQPDDMNMKQLTGAGILAGIGFTMSIFITVLAFEDPALIKTAKIAILTASVAAAVLGSLVIWRASR